MPQDIRELLRQDNQIPTERLKAGHEQRFLALLETELPQEKKRRDYSWMRIAASVVVILSVSLFTFNNFKGGAGLPDETVVNANDALVKNSTVVLDKQTSPLAEISPEYETVENHYLTSIKFELAKITVDDTNRELVESFMRRLEKLDQEYQVLNKEFIKVGMNSDIVEALIENLKIRLNLLGRLNQKLKELENIENENYSEIQA